MTTTATDQSLTAAAALRPVTAGVRLVRLYLISRRVPAAVAVLAVLGCLLWAALYWQLKIVGGPAAQLAIPLVIETAAAAVVAVSSRGPFGDPERATGRRLPRMCVGTSVALTIVAFLLLAAGSAGGHLPGGSLALLRNLAGMTGIGLLSAAALGGAFGWVGPMSYLLVIEGGLADGWTTPWAWPGRPAHDLGGALCASVVLAAGLVALALLGARRAERRVGPE